MIDVTEVRSPGWWLQRLMGKLAERRDDYLTLQTYFEGDQAVPVLASKNVSNAYRRLMTMANTNFAELVVEAPRERMQVTGFRTGQSGDAPGDDEAWRIWQANSLDADSSLVHRTALSLRDAYVIVGPVVEDIGAPLITPESPLEVYAEPDPVRRRVNVAAIKVFYDEIDGLHRAYLFLPGKVLKASRVAAEGDQNVTMDPSGWDWDDTVAAEQDLPGGIVPVVRFVNRQGFGSAGTAEFEPHIPMLNRIGYKTVSLLEVATMQAFRQRAIKGIPLKDAEGRDINYDDVFEAGPGALWHLPATAEMWESGQVDLGPIRQAIRDDVQDLAAVTRTPLYYLTPESSSGSAEGAALAREGLVFKTSDKLVQMGESWERVMSLAFLMAGDNERAKREGMEVVWADPQRFSLSERADAASKASTSGMPWRAVARDIWQKSPQEIDEWETMRMTDALLAPEAPAPPAAVRPAAPVAPVDAAE